MTLDEVMAVAEIVERAAKRYNEQAAAHERTMQDHRMAFNARTEADRKIIEGLRSDLAKERDEHQVDADHLNEEIARFRGIADDLCNRLNALGIQAAKRAGEALGMVEGEGLLGAAQRVVKERDGLLTQVQDQRAEIERLRNDERKAYQDGEALRAEVERLKTTARWVRRTRNPQKWATVGAVASVRGYLVRIDDKTETLWESTDCEPCDPPADHDTPAGKEAAEAAAPSGAHVSLCDVRKVPQ